MATFTLVHLLISLIGIGSGLVVLYGLLNSQRLDGSTRVFLWSTLLTSVTGFLFPFHGFTPAIGVGILSVILLAVAFVARYRKGMAGGWRKAYIITAVTSLYFNVFVLVVQSFQKIPALRELAPTQSEPPFAVAQLTVLAAFVILGFLAVRRFRKDLPQGARGVAAGR